MNLTTYVTLLRGINVGGHNKLPMVEFRKLLTELGCKDVATYIQSGNAVFRHRETGRQLNAIIAGAIEHAYGFSPHVLALSASEFRSIATANPFANAALEPNLIHISFLAEPAVAGAIDCLSQRQAGDEEILLTAHALYLAAPDGIARSKLASDAERCLGVPATSRNWRTVCRLLEMLDA